MNALHACCVCDRCHNHVRAPGMTMRAAMHDVLASVEFTQTGVAALVLMLIVVEYAWQEERLVLHTVPL